MSQENGRDYFYYSANQHSIQMELMADLVCNFIQMCIRDSYIMDGAAAPLREKYPNHTPRPEDVLREFLKQN